MSRVRFLSLLAWLAVLCAWASAPAALARAGEITFYSGTGMPPYVFEGEGGKPDGLAVRLLQAIMEEAGEPFSVDEIVVTNWTRAIHNAEYLPGAADLLLAMIPEREGQFKLVGPLDGIAIGVFARKTTCEAIRDPLELRKYRIGVVRDTAPVSMLKNLVPDIDGNLEKTTCVESHMRMLREGRVDMIVTGVGNGAELLKEMGMNPDDYHVVYPLGVVHFYYGFNPATDNGYIARLQSALDRIKKPAKDGASRYDRIRAEYIR